MNDVESRPGGDPFGRGGTPDRPRRRRRKPRLVCCYCEAPAPAGVKPLRCYRCGEVFVTIRPLAAPDGAER
jgi:hypothetical protein